MTEKEAVCHLSGALMALKTILKIEMTQEDKDAIGILVAMAADREALNGGKTDES